jgi:hypothetical protein
MSALDTGTTLTSSKLLLRALSLALAVGTTSVTASAQSIVAGSMAGVITDSVGNPLSGVHLILTQVASGITRDAETDREGEFEFLLLQPGEYQLFAERLGDRPVLVDGIPVGQGRRVTVTVALRPVPLPVMDVSSTTYGDAALKIGGREGGRVFTGLEIGRLPYRSRELSELGKFASNSSASLAIEGLPSQFTGYVVDGALYQSALHGGLPQQDFATAGFAMSQFEQAQMVTDGVDVEYHGMPGASLSAFSRRGTKQLEFGAYADWAGSATSSADYLSGSGLSFNSARGGIVASGPIVTDTSHFVVGFEARRLETPLPSVWEATSLDTAFVTVAADSFGVNLADYLEPRLSSANLYSGFGRIDWQFGETTALMVRAEGASLETTDPVLGRKRTPTRGVALDGSDISGGASLATMISRLFGLELRVGVISSTREYSAGDLPVTSLAEGPIVLGTDPVIPAKINRFAFWANEVLHFRIPGHRMKLGGTARISALDYTYTPWRDGGFSFGSVDDFASRQGRYTHSLSAAPTGNFSTAEIGGYLQDTWTPLPGVSITGGFRLDWEMLPEEEVWANEDWLTLTGLRTDSFPSTMFKFSPRAGLTVERSSYQVRADWTIHYGAVDPWSFAEAVTTSRGIDSQRGFNQLSSWPNPPDSMSAPVLGSTLTVLGPNQKPPRTIRTSLGFTAAVGSSTTFDISGAYRHTDYLLRRHNLNLATLPSGQDQFGRDMYGTTSQVGGIVGTVPGSNRRFAAFDVVSSLDPDGFSDYWGISVGLQRRVGSSFHFFTSYTYSQTKDNWLSGLGGPPESQFTPFPDSLREADWADGRSDFDVPHVLTLGAEFDLGLIRLGAFYRGQSGLPFTPGFRNGQDMNGEGSFTNDPAFVDNQIAGVAELMSEWSCLEQQIGQFAERNSCRGPTISTLDVRVTLSTIRIGGSPVELVVDGLNLLDSDVDQLDGALFLIDPNGTTTIDQVTGTVDVPLIVNPNFGKPLVRYSTGRAVRLGARVNYD